MKRMLRTGLVLSLVLLGVTNTVLGQDVPAPNANNCAGVVVSSLAGPGLGTQVAALAQLQGVDNLGLASCGDTPRQNP
jgi:hypothetical protein